MRFNKLQTLALCIDVQERLFPHIDQFEALEKNIQLVIKGLNVLGVPIALSEQYKKGLGETLPTIKSLIDPIFQFEKTAFSCADDSTFEYELTKEAKEQIILFGIEAHICVLQTAIDLKSQGLEPIVVVDCIGSRTSLNKEIALERLKQEGVFLTTYEAILFELCQKAGNEQFKAISMLVK